MSDTPRTEPEFSDWMLRLTSEGLHSKADIAEVIAKKDRDLTAAQAKIAELERERDAATTLLPSLEQTINHLRAQIDAAAVREARATERIAELERERDALRVDAERYRWLRAGQKNFEVSVADDMTDDPVWYTETGANLDAAIDAAREER